MPSEGLFQCSKILLYPITAKLVGLLKQKRATRCKDPGVFYTIQGKIVQCSGVLPGARIRNCKARKNQGTPFPNVSGISGLFFSDRFHFSCSAGQLSAFFSFYKAAFFLYARLT